MLLAANLSTGIVMTADMRTTYTDTQGHPQILSEEYKKVFNIENRYILCSAGRVKILEKALEYINEHIETVESNNEISLFQNAFVHGKSSFLLEFPNMQPTSVFFLGYMKNGENKLMGFSSDDNYQGIEVSGVVKLNTSNHENESTLTEEVISFIQQEIVVREPTSPSEFADIYFASIQRIDNPTIGKTATSLILIEDEILEISHS